jgi:hypothetical protein
MTNIFTKQENNNKKNEPVKHSDVSGMKKIFGSKLQHMYDCGELKNVLESFGDGMNERRFIGYGHDASCFSYTKKLVLKLCTKQTQYFKYFDPATPENLHHLVSSLTPLLLPIKEILYEDKNVFVYTQPFCQKFNIHQLSQQYLYEIIQIEFQLFQQNVSASTSIHNLGIYKNHIVIFDYHDLRPLWLTENWRRRVIKHLIHNIYYCYCDHKKPKNTLNEILNHVKFPKCYVILIEQLRSIRLSHNNLTHMFNQILNMFPITFQ